MALTRSKKQQETDKKPTKIKFSESEDEPVNDSQYFSAEDDKVDEDIQQDDDSDDSGSDSDAAPEEESTSTSKEAILERQREQFRLRQEKNRQERERRRQLDLQNKQQQEDSKKSRKKQMSTDDLPEFLPTDILGSDDDEQEESASTSTVKNKHLKSNELDEIELRRQIKLQKLKDLKSSKKTVVKKGPVSVQVHDFNSRKIIVPAAESKIIESRDNWLKRKSLRRK